MEMDFLSINNNPFQRQEEFQLIFAKKTKQPPYVPTYDELHLQSELLQTKWALDCAYSNFENVVEPDLIDCYIYELKAIQTRYGYLLGKAKELENKRSLNIQDTLS